MRAYTLLGSVMACIESIAELIGSRTLLLKGNSTQTALKIIHNNQATNQYFVLILF